MWWRLLCKVLYIGSDMSSNFNKCVCPSCTFFLAWNTSKTSAPIEKYLIWLFRSVLKQIKILKPTSQLDGLVFCLDCCLLIIFVHVLRHISDPLWTTYPFASLLLCVLSSIFQCLLNCHIHHKIFYLYLAFLYLYFLLISYCIYQYIILQYFGGRKGPK